MENVEGTTLATIKLSGLWNLCNLTNMVFIEFEVSIMSLCTHFELF